jgi:membrane glycosyltransferase
VTGLSFALSSSTLASKLLQSSIPFLVSLLLSFERENIGNKNKIEFTLRREKLRIEVESYHVVVVVFFLFGFENEKGKGGLGR